MQKPKLVNKTVKISIEGLTLPISRQYKTMVVKRASMWSVEVAAALYLKTFVLRRRNNIQCV